MKNKRGQFYIVAALIIVLAIIGLTSTTTYAYTKSNTNTIYKLSSELKQESIQIIDYGIYNNQDLNQFITDEFSTKTFPDYFFPKTDNLDLFLIYGNDQEIRKIQYIQVNKGTINSDLTIAQIKEDYIIKETIDSPLPIEEVQVEIQETTHTFNLKPGENFYFIIANQKGDELFIEKNN
ncbi:hypothetical protein HOE04_00825 [archaeon]|jgi:hypothetical protein|nr:hypothetical protein [archaeon]